MSTSRHARGCTCSTNCKVIARLESLGMTAETARAVPEDAIGRLLEFSVDFEETPEEAETELVAQGVDVPAFLERVHEAIEQTMLIRLAPTTRGER